MSKWTREDTGAAVDSLLKFLAGGGVISVALLAPNSAQVFEKPLLKILDKLDDRARRRELSRITHYMKSRGLIAYDSRDYEHGIRITKAGRARVEKSDFDNLQIPRPRKWDKKWRLIFFDIPIDKNKGRWGFTYKLRILGFQPLQKSIWVHPFPCREEVEAVALRFGLRKYITYVEISKIDSEKKLRLRFSKLLD